MTLRERLKQFEKMVIEEELRRDCGQARAPGRMERVSKMLGISRKNLWEKMRKYSIDKTSVVAQPQERLAAP